MTATQAQPFIKVVQVRLSKVQTEMSILLENMNILYRVLVLAFQLLYFCPRSMLSEGKVCF